jgi:catechol 2,3-dioxygenase-like lactoylglutathione lyase family enzyme
MSELPVDANHSYLGVYAVNVFVRDQDKSLQFYLEQLGFSLAFDGPPSIWTALGWRFPSRWHSRHHSDRT